MRYIIDPEFKTLVRRLTEAEYSALEASIVAEGCRDALVIWRGYGIIVDGHNRYDICQKHGIAFRVEERDFPDRQTVKVWILKNALARRNLTDGERFEVAILLKDELAEVGKEKKIEAGKVAREKQLGVLSVNDKTPQTEPVKEEPKHDTRKEMASNLGLALTRLCDAVANECRQSYLLIVRHEMDCEHDINASEQMVTDVYHERKWNPVTEGWSLKRMIDLILEKHNRLGAASG